MWEFTTSTQHRITHFQTSDAIPNSNNSADGLEPSIKWRLYARQVFAKD